MIAAQVAAGAPYLAVALPRSGNLMMLSDVELMLLHASLRGRSDEALIEALSANLQTLGRSIQKDGQTLEASQRSEELTRLVARFQSHTLPLLLRLEAVA